MQHHDADISLYLQYCVCGGGVQNEVESDTLTSESVWLTEKFILGNKNGPEINNNLTEFKSKRKSYSVFELMFMLQKCSCEITQL